MSSNHTPQSVLRQLAQTMEKVRVAALARQRAANVAHNNTRAPISPWTQIYEKFIEPTDPGKSD